MIIIPKDLISNIKNSLGRFTSTSKPHYNRNTTRKFQAVKEKQMPNHDELLAAHQSVVNVQMLNLDRIIALRKKISAKKTSEEYGARTLYYEFTIDVLKEVSRDTQELIKQEVDKSKLFKIIEPLVLFMFDILAAKKVDGYYDKILELCINFLKITEQINYNDANNCTMLHHVFAQGLYSEIPDEHIRYAIFKIGANPHLKNKAGLSVLDLCLKHRAFYYDPKYDSVVHAFIYTLYEVGEESLATALKIAIQCCSAHIIDQINTAILEINPKWDGIKFIGNRLENYLAVNERLAQGFKNLISLQKSNHLHLLELLYKSYGDSPQMCAIVKNVFNIVAYSPCIPSTNVFYFLAKHPSLCAVYTKNQSLFNGYIDFHHNIECKDSRSHERFNVKIALLNGDHRTEYANSGALYAARDTRNISFLKAAIHFVWTEPSWKQEIPQALESCVLNLIDNKVDVQPIIAVLKAKVDDIYQNGGNWALMGDNTNALLKKCEKRLGSKNATGMFWSDCVKNVEQAKDQDVKDKLEESKLVTTKPESQITASLDLA